MLISNNSFLVLWLAADADDKIITKRYKEILHLLAIDETASYDQDIPLVDYTHIRYDTTVKYAYSLLTNQQKKAWQTLFWFQIITIEDGDAYALLQNGQHLEVYEYWMSLYEDTANTIYLKNALIIWLLVYENSNLISIPNVWDLAMSLVDGFHRLYHSKRFWNTFLHTFNIHNTVPLQEGTLHQLKQSFPADLAQGFFSISSALGDYDLYKKFVQKFSIHAKWLQSNQVVVNILRPIEQSIKNVSTLNLGHDIDKAIYLIHSSISAMQKLEDIWLYDSNFIIKIRDNLAKKIRLIAVDVYNDYSNPKASLTIMKYAIWLFHDPEYKKTCQKDIDYLQPLVSVIPKRELNFRSSYRTWPLPPEYVGKNNNVNNTKASRSSYRTWPLPSENVGRRKYADKSTRSKSSYRRWPLPPEHMRENSIQNDEIFSGIAIQDIIIWFIVIALFILVVVFV